jgi:hypothetical protein
MDRSGPVSGSILDEFLTEKPGAADGDRRDGQDGKSPSEFERYVAMLDVELAGGNRLALPYAALLRITFDPSAGIELHYPEDKVRIEGRRLGDLYRALRQHRLASVRAGEAFDGKAGDPVITAVHWDHQGS